MPTVHERTVRERADLAEHLVPIAAHLVCAVHDEGPEAVQRVVSSVPTRDRDALAVVLAAMVNPDATTADTLGWVTWDERATIPQEREETHAPTSEEAEERRAHTAMYQHIRGGGTKATAPAWMRDGERAYQRRRMRRNRADARAASTKYGRAA